MAEKKSVVAELSRDRIASSNPFRSAIPNRLLPRVMGSQKPQRFGAFFLIAVVCAITRTSSAGSLLAGFL
jgi:hypothetical protein